MPVKIRLLYSTMWLVSSLFLIIIVINLYSINKENQIQILRIEEESHVNVMKESSLHAMENLISDVLVQSSHAHLDNFFGEEKSQNMKYLAQEYKKFIDYTEYYDQIRLIDPTGMEIIRVNSEEGKSRIVPQEQLQNKSNRYYVRLILSLEADEIYFSPFDLNVENGEIEIPRKPMIRMGIPLFDDYGSAKGFIILNFLGDKILQYFKPDTSLDNTYPMLINSEGYWLKSSEGNRDWGFMYGNADNRFPVDFEDEWKQIIHEDKGQFQTEKGLFTFETIYPTKVIKKEGYRTVTTTDKGIYWKIVSLIPRDELNNQFQLMLKISIAIISIGCVFISALFMITYLFKSKKVILELEKENLIRDLTQALSNVKTLSGLVPICSNCKNIRDDKGFWNNLEKYIQEHTDAQLSHGLCPKCADELYGDQDWYKKKTNT